MGSRRVTDHDQKEIKEKSHLVMVRFCSGVVDVLKQDSFSAKVISADTKISLKEGDNTYNLFV